MTAKLNADELLACATADTGMTDYADPTLPRVRCEVERCAKISDTRVMK